MAEYIESKCRDCFNLAPCAAWIKHGTMLYSDFSYSVEGCQYFVSAADVVPVVHGRWERMKAYCTQYVCSECGDIWPDFRSDYCPNCGARMDGE